MTNNFEKFDLQIVHDHFTSALHDSDDIRIESYLQSFDELNKFFTLMGSVFGFVSSDLKSKTDILNQFLQDDKYSDKFSTVRSMIEYEKQNNLLTKNSYVSGSRTLLRLHRGLDFIREFLRRIGELQDDEYVTTVCREAYDKTLAKHHSFFIRKGAKLAMYTLPNRQQLLLRVCVESEHIERALNILPKTLDVIAIVFERIETIYTVHDLHSLP